MSVDPNLKKSTDGEILEAVLKSNTGGSQIAKDLCNGTGAVADGLTEAETNKILTLMHGGLSYAEVIEYVKTL